MAKRASKASYHERWPGTQNMLGNSSQHGPVINFRLLPRYITLLIGTITLFVSCGKKASSVSSPDPIRAPQNIDMDDFLSKQQVICQSELSCPDYIAKIVVLDGDKKKYCTGFLTDPNTIATSSSCLSGLIRQDEQDCSRDVFVFFPKTNIRTELRASCKKVLKASPLEGSDPIFWRNDVAYLQLGEQVYRRPLIISREGLATNKEFVMWSVDQSETDDYVSFIRRSVCEAVHRTYINPLVTNETSPNMVFAGCDLKKGNTGAPITDSRGKLRGMASAPVDPKLVDWISTSNILEAPLKAMFHGTNFACAPSPYDNEVSDIDECNKYLTYPALDEARKLMLDPTILFGRTNLELERVINISNRFIQLGVKLSDLSGSKAVEIVPVCFKNTSDWINGRNNQSFRVMLPRKSLKRAMDAYSRVIGLEEDRGEATFEFRFSAKQLRSNGVANVSVGNDQENRSYSSIPICSTL